MGMIGPCERAPDGRCKLPTTTEVVLDSGGSLVEIHSLGHPARNASISTQVQHCLLSVLVTHQCSTQCERKRR